VRREDLGEIALQRPDKRPCRRESMWKGTYSLWMRLRMNLGTFGPGIKG